MKRKLFLEAFLGALEAKEILLTDVQFDKVFGTVVYDQNDAKERQEFVWHMTENNVPSEHVKNYCSFFQKTI